MDVRPSIKPYQCLLQVKVMHGFQFSSSLSACTIVFVASQMHPTQPTDDAQKHFQQIVGL